jgi:transglutaminase-like putative cysteine protease
LPARPVAGFWGDKNNDWHVWGEFRLPTGEWIPVDASQADRSGNADENFASLDNRRGALAKSYQIDLQTPAPRRPPQPPAAAKREKDAPPEPRTQAEFLQSGSWWWTWRGKGDTSDLVSPGAKVSLKSKLAGDA